MVRSALALVVAACAAGSDPLSSGGGAEPTSSTGSKSTSSGDSSASAGGMAQGSTTGTGGPTGSGGAATSSGTTGTSTSTSASTSSSASGTGGGAAGCSLTKPCDADEPDPSIRCNGIQVNNPVMAPPVTAWASSVIAFSSQYSSGDWAATHATGTPDTYPNCADFYSAWAPSTMDGGMESITLGFTPPAAGSQIWIYETFNPDAVTTVTVTTATGDKVVYQGLGQNRGTCAYVLSVQTGTKDPISQVKIDLNTTSVPDFNEIDAVGIVP